MDNPKFQEIILSAWERARQQKHPTTITHSADIVGQQCGDTVYIEACIENDILIEIGVFPRACCIAEAGSVIIAEWAIGKTIQEIKVCTNVEILKIAGVKIPENRHGCFLIGLQALKALESHIERK